MPLYRRPDEKGDLYVLIDIEMPDQDWLSSIDRNVSLSALIFSHESKSEVGLIYSQVLISVLPPKRSDVDPQPDIVDEANFEESDILDVRARSFPASPNFFDQGFPSQFGGDENWEDENEDEDDGNTGINLEPECRPQ